MRLLNARQYPAAIAELKQVAAGNDSAARAEAQYNLAVIYLPEGYRRGQSRPYPAVSSNTNEGLKWLNLAARSGHGHAMFMMGAAEQDAGNIDRARYWFQRASSAGLSEARVALTNLR
jgi:hypothetical protein